jgi:protein-S-isoprenylcysteine O-methyltransferase Ste14
MSPQLVIFYVWDGWPASWVIASLWTIRATRWPAFRSQVLLWVITLVGAYLLLGAPSRDHEGPGRLWDVFDPLGWALIALAIAGLGFAWSARLYLVRLWSASVTRKADHRVVDTGLYAVARHPIYTGIITVGLATGLLRGTIVARGGAAAMALDLRNKARLEGLPSPGTGPGRLRCQPPQRTDAGAALAEAAS